MDRPTDIPDETVFPVVMWRGRRAEISDGYYPSATATHREHLGVDIMFRRSPADTIPVDSKRGSKHYVMPDGVDAVSWADGKLWSAGYSQTHGHWCVIDHGPHPFATFYQHMSELAVPFKRAGGGGPVIRAGQRLGTVGGAPTGYGLAHLHFEIWRGARDKHTDPAPYLKFARHIGSSILYQLAPVLLLALGAILATRLAVA